MSKGLWIILPEHSEGQILGVWGDPGRGGVPGHEKPRREFPAGGGGVAYGITEPLSGPEAS